MRKVVWGVSAPRRSAASACCPACSKSAAAARSGPSRRATPHARARPPTRSASRSPTARTRSCFADPEIEADLQPAAQSPARAAHARGRRGRQARAVREADRAHRRRGRCACATPPGKVLIAEAFMVRFHPQWQRARELVREGRIGDAARGADVLRLLQPRSRQRPQPRRHRRRRPVRHRLLCDRRGPLSSSTPSRLRAIALVDRDPGFGTDRLTSGAARFRRRAGASTSRSRRRSRRTSACSCAAARAASRSRSRSTRRRARRRGC